MLKSHDVGMAAKTIQNGGFALHLTEPSLHHHHVLHVLLRHSSLFDSFQSHTLVARVHHGSLVHDPVFPCMGAASLPYLGQ